MFHPQHPELPSKVRVLAVEYDIVLWDKATAEQNENLGMCDLDHSRIFVSPLIPPTKFREVLLHECMHALWDALGMSGREPDEEFAVGQLAVGLIVFCRDNPELAEFFFGRTSGSTSPSEYLKKAYCT